MSGIEGSSICLQSFIEELQAIMTWVFHMNPVVCLTSVTYISLEIFQFYVLRPHILTYDTLPGLVYFMRISNLESIIVFGV